MGTFSILLGERFSEDSSKASFVYRRYGEGRLWPAVPPQAAGGLVRRLTARRHIFHMIQDPDWL